MTITPAAGGIGTPGAGGIGGLQGARTQPAPQAPEGNTFEQALDGIADSLSDADKLSQQVATGQLADLSQLTAAAAKAELGVQLTVAFRDRAVESFQQIMRMQI